MRINFYPLFLILCTAVLFCAGSAAGDPCLECHEKKTPGVVDYWKKSAHFKKNIFCADCHGQDIEANHEKRISVDAARCGLCHKKALAEHRLSKHGIGLRTVRACTRGIETSAGKEKSCTFCHKPDSADLMVKTECAMFLAQTPEMQRQGCNSCHIVELRCDTCHTKHGTDLSLAKNPATCGTCHMGPDHPQAEMWESSPHGVIYRHGDKGQAPSCVTCHMSMGSHNVSRGIALGLDDGAAGLKKQEREFMIGICASCHTEALAKRNLDDADRIEKAGRELLDEAQHIIEGLQKEGLLYPSPSERPRHPLFGASFVIGPHMLYENLSLVESLFFKMKQFYYLSSYKGAFHQNPDYTHWYGNAPLKLTLSEIKSEAALLRQVNTIRQRVDNLGVVCGPSEGEIDEIRKKLGGLRERRLKGEITDKDYETGKLKILEEKGL